MSTRRLSTKNPQKAHGALSREEAETIAVQALAHIAADDDRLNRCLALTGLDPAGLRTAAAEPGFLACVLDHLAGYEPDFLDFASQSRLAPERIAAARLLLSGPAIWND
ncbi:MAG: DUF3572 domain-containing protein [Rhodoblastus sp.]